MLLVVDSNRFFSALISKGLVFDIFFVNKLLRKFEFIAPEYLFTEIGEHFDEIIERSKLSTDELAKVFGFIKGEIDFIPFSDFNMFASEAEQLSSDPDDVEYVALALKFNCGIWSDDKALKGQSRFKVLGTEQVIDLLLGRKETKNI